MYYHYICAAMDNIRTCPMTNDMARKNLVKRYENKRVLMNSQWKTLFIIPSISKESGPSIKSLQRTINDFLTNFSLLGIETRNWDIRLIYICSTRPPEHTLSLREQSQGPCWDLPKWSKMDEFLTARFRTLESVSDIIGSHNFSQGTAWVSNQTTLFVCVLSFWECRLVNAYYLLKSISVAGIVWPFPMSQKDPTLPTFAIFGNKNIIRYSPKWIFYPGETESWNQPR